MSWVSDTAREIWQPRLQQITQAWLELEWRSVIAGIRACALTSVSPEEFVAQSSTWVEQGLIALPLQVQGVSQYAYSSTGIAVAPGKPIALRIVLGKTDSALAFKQAYDANDNLTIGQLLGFPECCQKFFQQVWVEQGCVDTTWQMAANTRLPEDRIVDITCSPYANILWRWMGIRSVPHLPCSFHCQSTIALGQQLVQLGRDDGFTQEMDWLMEILNWSVEWSALHGIAEIKTPILKVATRTDATPYKYTVRRVGNATPAAGARGLNFPYTVPSKPLVTGSKAYQRGIEQAIAAPTAYPDWYATDNGFASRLAMESAHRPILDLALATVGTSGGTVVDLGCGNGALLQKLWDANPKIIPYGIEVEHDRFRHIATLLPQFAENFVCGNLFTEESLWQSGKQYDLALLMPGRLLEMGSQQASLLKQRLRQHCKQILIYAYGDWLTRYNSLAELAAPVGLKAFDSGATVKCSLASIPA